MRLQALSVLLAGLFPGTLLAETPPSLRQVFSELPAPFLDIWSVKAKHSLDKSGRLKLITVDDPKNGYLEAKGNEDTDIFGGAQLALFKTTSGRFLVGMRIDRGDDTTDIHFLKKKGTTWQDVTGAVLPKITETMVDQRMQDKVPSFKRAHGKLSDCASGTYAYKLPRRGTTVEVYVESDCYDGPRLSLWCMPFDGQKFALKDCK